MKTNEKIGISILIVICIAIILGLGYFIVRETVKLETNISASEYTEGDLGNLPIKWRWTIQKDPAYLQVQFVSDAQLHGCRGGFDGTEEVRLVPTCKSYGRRYRSSNTSSCLLPEQMPPYVSSAPNIEYILVEKEDGQAKPFEGLHTVRLDCDEGTSEWQFEIRK